MAFFGYNGLLVGNALATLLYRGDDGWDAWVGIACVVGGGLSAIVQLSLGNTLVPTFHAPPFTLAFNVTMLLFVLGAPASIYAPPTHCPCTAHALPTHCPRTAYAWSMHRL